MNLIQFYIEAVVEDDHHLHAIYVIVRLGRSVKEKWTYPWKNVLVCAWHVKAKMAALTCFYIHTYNVMCVCVCIYIYIYIYVHTQSHCVYIYIHTYISNCVYIHIYIYTHTHTHTKSNYIYILISHYIYIYIYTD